VDTVPDLQTADLAKLRQLLILHEGIRLRPYTDTVGKLTIGVGRNLTDRGITLAEAMLLLDTDLDECLRWLRATFPWWADLSPARQAALVDLRFNLGGAGLLKFKRFLAAMEAGDYGRAAEALRASRWARQVKTRAPRVIRMVETGEWPDGLA
jgi:lysozyme